MTKIFPGILDRIKSFDKQLKNQSLRDTLDLSGEVNS